VERLEPERRGLLLRWHVTISVTPCAFDHAAATGPLKAALPGRLFLSLQLGLPAGHFGMGHGTGAHAPDEYYLIESTNPKVQGLDGAVASFVEYLYALS